MVGLLSVAEALKRITSGVVPLEGEDVVLADAAGRVLAAPCVSSRTQPPFPASAMDGYAARSADLSMLPCTLRSVGESAAGHGYHGPVHSGECVRIFTGAPVPSDCDTIIIQENTEVEAGNITVLQGEEPGRYIRPAGLDFEKGETLAEPGDLLTPQLLSLCAAMNLPKVHVRRKPLVAVISSGDELVPPGTEPGTDQIVSSNNFGVAAICRDAGAEVIDLGIAADTLEALEEKFSRAQEADIIVTLGGASVGDHDLVRQALEQRDVHLDFWKLAMRPGKPVMFGTDKGGRRYLGLPGNPVSSLVCSLVFLVPLIGEYLARPAPLATRSALLARDLPENDQREEYMRAEISERDGKLWVNPFTSQDSSRLSLLHRADCLLIRAAHAPAAAKGAQCEIVMLPG